MSHAQLLQASLPPSSAAFPDFRPAPMDAMTEALAAKSLGPTQSSSPRPLSFPFLSFLVSSVLSLLSLLFFLSCSLTVFMLMTQWMGKTSFNLLPSLFFPYLTTLLLDVSFSLLYLHRLSTTPRRASHAAFFRVRFVALTRLLSPNPLYRSLFFHWHSQHRLTHFLLIDIIHAGIMSDAHSREHSATAHTHPHPHCSSSAVVTDCCILPAAVAACQAARIRGHGAL